MTKTQVFKRTSALPTKTPSPDSRPRLGPMVPIRKRARRNILPETQVLPAELLLDDDKKLLIAVGETALPLARLGLEEWPLPNELLLLLEPEQQPEVLAEVGLDDQ